MRYEKVVNYIYGSAKTYADDEPITRTVLRGIGDRGGKCFHASV